MSIKKTLAMAGIATTALFGTTKIANAQNTEAPSNSAKIVQQTEEKSETRQKIAYLDEYVANIENGMAKEKALKIFEKKLANGDSKKLEEIEKQVAKMNKNMIAHDNVLAIMIGATLLTGFLCAARNNSGTDIQKYIQDALNKKSR